MRAIVAETRDPEGVSVGWSERIEKAPKVVVVCALQPDSGEKCGLEWIN